MSQLVLFCFSPFQDFLCYSSQKTRICRESETQITILFLGVFYGDFGFGRIVAMNGNIGGKVPIGECKATVVYMSGYLPGAAPEKSPILSPVPVRLPAAVHGGDSWKDVCGGGCGFAMAISGRIL